MSILLGSDFERKPTKGWLIKDASDLFGCIRIHSNAFEFHLNAIEWQKNLHSLTKRLSPFLAD